jgi:hypothetical protein
MKLLSKRRNLNSATASPADTAGLASFVGPAAVENMPRHIKIGDGYAATLIVTGYPAEVGGAWLDPLLAWPGRLDVVVYIDPLAPQVAAARLRRQRARFESNRRGDAGKGRLADPMTEAAADDAAELADRIARGQAKLFRVGLYLCVHAPTLAELEEAVAHVRATAASVLLDTQPATWRQLQGWLATLPLASDGLGMRRVMDTDAIATAFPVASADLPAPLPGIALGVGGVRLNPLDIHPGTAAPRPAPTGPCSSTPWSVSSWDSSRHRRSGPRWTRRSTPRTTPPGSPTTRPPGGDKRRSCVRGRCPDRAGQRGGRNPRGAADPVDHRLVQGDVRRPTTTVPQGQMVAWSTRHLADELRAPGMLLALDAVWRDVDAPAVWSANPPRRLVFVDEAWTLLRDGEGARFLSRLAKSARKRRAGLAVITQDVGDLPGSDLGQVVIANAAAQILLRQASQAVDVVADVFGLTAGEARLLLGARRGEGLLLSGTQRVSFQAVASKKEHRLCIGDLELADDD